MKYLCLIHSEREKLDVLPKDELDAILNEYFAVTDEIKKSGHYLASAALQPARTAVIVRMRNGKLSTTDRPFAETKEQLGGFFLIDARDLNEAIQVAATIPGARWGSVEVRPVLEPTPP
jgi:hypothetical protein